MLVSRYEMGGGLWSGCHDRRQGRPVGAVTICAYLLVPAPFARDAESGFPLSGDGLLAGVLREVLL
jgi:hypothetical protein